MKPINNRIFCIGCRHTKMLFESEAKADNFIRFNRDEIAASSGKIPTRSYYCSFCCGWHVTSVEDMHWAQEHNRRDEEIWRQIKDLSGKSPIDDAVKNTLPERLGVLHNMTERCRLLLLRIDRDEALEVYKELILEFSLLENLTHRKHVYSDRIGKVRNKLQNLQSAFDVIEEYDTDSVSRQRYLNREDSAKNRLAVDYFINKEFVETVEIELDRLEKNDASLEDTIYNKRCDEIAAMINENRSEALTPLRKKLLGRLRNLRIERHRKRNPKPERICTNANRTLYFSIIGYLELAHEAINENKKLRCSNLLKTAECLMPDTDDDYSRILWVQIQGLRHRLDNGA